MAISAAVSAALVAVVTGLLAGAIAFGAGIAVGAAVGVGIGLFLVRARRQVDGDILGRDGRARFRGRRHLGAIGMAVTWPAR